MRIPGYWAEEPSSKNGVLFFSNRTHFKTDDRDFGGGSYRLLVSGDVNFKKNRCLF